MIMGLNSAEKKVRKLKKLANQQIQFLWKKHDETKGKENDNFRSGLLGKIVGIEWVLDTLKDMELAEEKDY